MSRVSDRMWRAAWSAGAAGALLFVAVGSGGCGVFGGGADAGGGAVYPSDSVQTRTADIQVVRDETHISFTNTTARSFGPGRLWVNRSFSRPFEGMGVGESVRLDLREFRDASGRVFRAGGFFATRSPKALVQVQYEEAGVAGLVGFVVVAGGAG